MKIVCAAFSIVCLSFFSAFDTGAQVPSFMPKSSINFESGKKGLQIGAVWNQVENGAPTLFGDQIQNTATFNFLDLGICINDLNKPRNINVDFKLVDFEALLNEYYFPIQYYTLSLINVKHSNQIANYVDWAKISLGIGNVDNIKNDSRMFYGVYGGIGVSSAYFAKDGKAFSDLSFHGPALMTGLILDYNYQSISIKSKNEVKGIFLDKTLFSITPGIEVSINLTKLLHENTNDLKHNFVKLDIGYSASQLYRYNSPAKDRADKFSIGLKYKF